MPQSESQIQRDILLAAPKHGVLLWRNNVINGWTGSDFVRHSGGYVTLSNARRVRAGLCKGSSDLIGITADGKFLAVEVKSARGRTKEEQTRFLEVVRNIGGIAGVCRSVEDFLRLIHVAS